MPPQVIVITDPHDAHLPFVQRHLTQPLIVIDPAALLNGKPLSFTFAGLSGATKVSYGDVRLDGVSGIWYRKPQPIADELLPVENELKPYCRAALEKQFMLLMTAFSHAVWVSPYYAALNASSKLLQLQAARRLGFAVPDTVFTGSTEVARAFLAKHPRSITKSIGNNSPTIQGERKVFLTTAVTPGTTPDLTNLHLAPAIFQEAIEAARDVRVTIVGNQVFPAYIESEHSKENAHVRDSRLGYYHGDVHLEAVTDFPKEVRDKCLAHTKAMGLTFSAIDLIQDQQGTFWFLENNANGQWAFVEEATGQPIGRAIADLLESGHKLGGST